MLRIRHTTHALFFTFFKFCLFFLLAIYYTTTTTDEVEMFVDVTAAQGMHFVGGTAITRLVPLCVMVDLVDIYIPNGSIYFSEALAWVG